MLGSRQLNQQTPCQNEASNMPEKFLRKPKGYEVGRQGRPAMPARQNVPLAALRAAGIDMVRGAANCR